MDLLVPVVDAVVDGLDLEGPGEVGVARAEGDGAARPQPDAVQRRAARAGQRRGGGRFRIHENAATAGKRILLRLEK